nr:sister chromatid cohesion 1 protein 4-like [Ziziphus jujuba var. spinosa]
MIPRLSTLLLMKTWRPMTCLLENSGWSSRTRAVAKYLQILFDKEAVHGRKVRPMDNLIAGSKDQRLHPRRTAEAL